MRSVVVVLPASMCAMIPMFRMRCISSLADSGTEPRPPSGTAEAQARLLLATAEAAPPRTIAAAAVARGAGRNGQPDRRSSPFRLSLSSSDMLCGSHARV